MYFDKPCPTGHYCPEGTKSSYEFPCPAGTYNTFGLQNNPSACKSCPAGSYCGSSGLGAVSGPCTAGYWCASAATTATPTDGTTGDECGIGEFCPEGSSGPTPCTAGSFCASPRLGAVTGPCKQGFYCPTGSTTDQPITTCPAGSYCQAGAATPTQCPPGTFSVSPGATSSSTCLQCTPGYYCESSGLSSVSGPCTAGFYCPGGDIHSGNPNQTCPIGHQCPLQSISADPCPQGSYQDQAGQASCSACPVGMYCPTFNTTVPSACPAGSYCPLATKFAGEFLCPAGRLSVLENLEKAADCPACPPSKYCASLGMMTVSGDCSEGYYCSGGATTGLGASCSNVSFYRISSAAFPPLTIFRHAHRRNHRQYLPAGSLLPGQLQHRNPLSCRNVFGNHGLHQDRRLPAVYSRLLLRLTWYGCASRR